MSKRQLLSLAEIRRAFGILDEAQELAREPYAARRHVAFELCKLLDARQAYYIRFDGFTPRDPVTVRDMVVGGWPDARMLRFWQQWGGRRMIREDPLVDRSTHLDGPCVTGRLHEIVTAGQWERSIAYEAFAEPGAVGDIIICFYRRQRSDGITGFSIQRSAGDADFTLRERRLVQMFNDEMFRRYRAGGFDADLTDEAVPGPRLSPRQHQTLEELLGCRGAGAAAQRLGLSRRTYEQYAQSVYEKFGVDGRPALMAKFVRA